ncbi:ABC transporter ATP-binding protein [Planosporangium flavigriseum]|uniref:ABC transporter ATP-binding protein n=1 Tax=Planosporangium flavigriseum TaxID=373681 RepID=A0A8J3PLZ8_9ACTN|nr:ABC transporter ATP-binding protein [Planosporangium flavigriseum]NJC65546.1 ABC transporter ATP-binding protein [Planosporangium flavigriseum]GIG75016.1 ABC transporter ATP-binding protein [Planosporangium flavigriseum]
MITGTKQVGVRIEAAVKSFGRGQRAVDSLDLDIRPGELLTVLGPSGSGKSTVLSLLAGLAEVDSGRIWFGDQDVTALPPEARKIGVVFQSAVLYPHLSLRESISFAPKLAGVPRDEINARIAEVAAFLQISHLLDRRPHEVSGGERQRAAIAKALVSRPTLLLMDEPFSALDAQLRRALRSQVVRLHREFGATTVFVTHDQEEALGMGDRVAVMRGGRLEQVAPPLELYRNPVNTWVANFVSLQPLNLLPVEYDAQAGEVKLCGETVRLAGPDRPLPATFTLGIRSENLRLRPSADGPLQVLTAEAVGEQVKYTVVAPDGTNVVALGGADQVFEPDAKVALAVDWPRAMVFDTETGARIVEGITV